MAGTEYPGNLLASSTSGAGILYAGRTGTDTLNLPTADDTLDCGNNFNGADQIRDLIGDDHDVLNVELIGIGANA